MNQIILPALVDQLGHMMARCGRFTAQKLLLLPAKLRNIKRSTTEQWRNKGGHGEVFMQCAFPAPQIICCSLYLSALCFYCWEQIGREVSCSWCALTEKKKKQGFYL